MSITLPNLDDRRYADLVEEARDLLVVHAPALTDHNPSDPAITLIELLAYFTEALLFRANTVTAANRLKFLRLLLGPDAPLPTSPAQLDAQIRDTVLGLRRTDRAVTAADFELLARTADPARIARAHCIPERNLEAADAAVRQQPQPSHVSVVIVPFNEADPSVARQSAADYLDPRRLLATQVHVVGARRVPIRIQATLRLRPDAVKDDVHAAAVTALTQFLDPIAGGDGGGWPFGRNVYVSEIYRLLDLLPGVDYVRRTLDPATSAPLDELATSAAFADRRTRNSAGELISIALDPDELPDYDVATTAADLAIDVPLMTFGDA
jgi:hypothetical protein